MTDLQARIIQSERTSAEYANDRLSTADELLWVDMRDYCQQINERAEDIRGRENHLMGLASLVLLIVAGAILIYGFGQ